MLLRLTRAPVLLLALGLTLSLQGVHAQTAHRWPKIGYVDAERILRDSTAANAAKVRIEAEFAPRQREIEAAITANQQAEQAFDREAAGLSDAERARRQLHLLDQERRIQRMRQTYSDDLNQAKAQALSILQDNANKAIRRIARAENFDLILQDATYFSPRVDITEKVIKALSEPLPDAAPSGR